MPPVHVAFCADPAYSQPLVVAVQSTVDTARYPHALHFWILLDDEDVATRALVRQVTDSAGAGCTFLPTSLIGSRLAGVPTQGHISAAAYYRLFLPELLPPGVARCVYLDSDVILRHPIEELWATDLGEYTVAAVMKPRAEEYRKLGLRSADDYFNSGVLVIDVARWQRQGVRAAALEFALYNSGCRHGHDQSALNLVFSGHWRRLDLRWNQQFKFFVHTAGYLHVNRAELRRLRRDPFLIHYTTSSKPWHAANDHPLRHCYFDVLDRTPLAGWRPAPVALPARLHALLWRPVPHWLRPGVLRNVYRPRAQALRQRLRRLTPLLIVHPLRR